MSQHDSASFPSVQDRKNALLVQPVVEQPSDKTFTTVQHALLRGIEGVFQLEEGEILAEPMPTREKRNGFLLYEATEGGAGVLSRLVSEEGMIAKVALEALQIMHFDIPDAAHLPSEASQLRDASETSCVAACYKCLMSYFNQPDHEVIDRRDEKAREVLLRLSQARTSALAPLTAASLVPATPAVPPGTDAAVAKWMGEATARGLPAPDVEPLQVGNARLSLIWRSHYLAASIESPGPKLLEALAERGIEIVAFGTDERGWDAGWARLATALGRST
jgi:hypothetical protein